MPDLLQPQPPPDVPAPGPSEAALKSRKKLKWLIAAGVGSMLLLAAERVSTRARQIRIMKHGCDRTELVANARQIALSLQDFSDEYGRFPDSTTAVEVRRKTGSTLSLSDKTSNDLFTQLLAWQSTRSERDFYAKTKSSIYPDNVWSSDATALAHGECAFAYIMGVDPKGNPSTPIAFGPVIPGTKTVDGKANYGKIAVVRVDHSVSSHPIDSAGKVIFEGLDLLDPSQYYWKGKAPDVKWPK